jgi:hypothetical protein
MFVTGFRSNIQKVDPKQPRPGEFPYLEAKLQSVSNQECLGMRISSNDAKPRK